MSKIQGKRSHAPVFWLLFGAGGMLSALIGAVLVFITGWAGPQAWGVGAEFMSYTHMHALAQNVLGKGFLWGVIALFAWHAAHRIKCSVHDLGIPAGMAVKLVCYGSAMLITLMAACALWRIGF